MEAETQFASLGSDRIAYQVLGHGPDLVLVTGTLSHVDLRWEEPLHARFLRRLASFSRLILFDPRGSGASDPISLDPLPTWEDEADDLAAVLAAVDSTEAAVFATSDSGPPAMFFAATRPDRVRALLLANTTARYLAAIRSHSTSSGRSIVTSTSASITAISLRDRFSKRRDPGATWIPCRRGRRTSSDESERSESMIQIRRANERGHAEHGWLDSYHTFSFADYHDPRFMGFRALRVINEDRVQPGRGFGTHPHRDMEIITYILEGALEHKDSMGTSSVIRPGEVQRMSAGTGVTHSEFNHSRTDLVHLLQIWIIPDEEGLPPSYEQRAFPDSERKDTLRLVASRDARDGSVKIHQDVDLYASLLSPGPTLEHPLAAGRHAWLQVARGSISANGEILSAGDGAAVSDEASVRIAAREPAELLLFDLA